MCSSRRSTVESNSHRAWFCSADEAGRGGRWTGINIAAMVVGFVLFWPIGLIVLFWIYSGRDVRDLPGAVRAQWDRMFHGDNGRRGESDNLVFNDYQQTQYDRIREIKEEIKSRAQRFSEFRMNAKRRADKEEFDNFMANGSKTGVSE